MRCLGPSMSRNISQLTVDSYVLSRKRFAEANDVAPPRRRQLCVALVLINQCKGGEQDSLPQFSVPRRPRTSGFCDGYFSIFLQVFYTLIPASCETPS